MAVNGAIGPILRINYIYGTLSWLTSLKKNQEMLPKIRWNYKQIPLWRISNQVCFYNITAELKDKMKSLKLKSR